MSIKTSHPHSSYLYIICSTTHACSNIAFNNCTNCNIKSYNAANTTTRNANKEQHITLMTQLTFTQSLAVTAALLICICSNLSFICWCLCCRTYRKQNAVIRHKPNIPQQQCIETLKQPTNTYKHVQTSINSYTIIPLKEPNNTGCNDEEDEESSKSSSSSHNSPIIDECIDIPNAPFLDMSELREDSLSDNNTAATRRGVETQVTFRWNDAMSPPSPKKQDNITEQKLDFDDSDGSSNDNDLNQDKVPHITVTHFNHGSDEERKGSLPVDTDDKEDFELLNSSKSPFEMSIISPRYQSKAAMDGDDVGMSEGKDAAAQNGEVVETVHAQDVQDKLDDVGVKSKRSLGRRSLGKVRTREMMQSGIDAVVDREMIVVLSDGNGIKKFEADGEMMEVGRTEVVADIKVIKGDMGVEKRKSLPKFAGKLEFLNHLDLEPMKKSSSGADENVDGNRFGFAKLFASPRSSRSPSPSPRSRSISAISPRKIINNIIRGSPRSDHEEEQELLMDESVETRETDEFDELDRLKLMRGRTKQ